MRRNPQDDKKVAVMDNWYVLIIMFLMAALIFFLFMLMSAGKALAVGLIPSLSDGVDNHVRLSGCPSVFPKNFIRDKEG